MMHGLRRCEHNALVANAEHAGIDRSAE